MKILAQRSTHSSAVAEREREGGGWGRQTDRQTQTDTDRQIDRQTDRQSDLITATRLVVYIII